jgi:hypothetical protein
MLSIHAFCPIELVGIGDVYSHVHVRIVVVDRTSAPVIIEYSPVAVTGNLGVLRIDGSTANSEAKTEHTQKGQWTHLVTSE